MIRTVASRISLRVPSLRSACVRRREADEFFAASSTLLLRVALCRIRSVLDIDHLVEDLDWKRLQRNRTRQGLRLTRRDVEGTEMPRAFHDLARQQTLLRERGFAVRADIGSRVNFTLIVIESDPLSVRQLGPLDFTLDDFRCCANRDLVGVRRLHHSMVLPPLTLMTCPVTNDDSVDARYATMEATSSISAGRPMGTTSMYFFTACGALANAFCTFSVFTMQGATTFKVIPSVANSRARPVVMPCTPPFAAL